MDYCMFDADWVFYRLFKYLALYGEAVVYHGNAYAQIWCYLIVLFM